ncbi:MAG TPA: peptide ABC transporter substrate-binding protein [Rhizomicrobium sp.]|jgi:oligopeptide transport system substrate-binding protein|nr:peptide ABC transporter substrate-binding protein [Rhizomicrobium sp.]
MAWNGLSRRMALAGGAAAAIAGGLVLKGQGKGASHARPEPGTFYFGNAAEPFTLDPTLSDASWEFYIIGDLMMGLTTEDVMARPIPGMAERWETSPDGLTWTFHLRDAVWSDGVPLTAGDFVFAWRRLLDPKTAASYAYFPYIIKNAEKINAGHLPGTALGVTTPDPRTLVMQLEHPAPYLAQMLMHSSMMPVPRHVVEKHGHDWARPGTYVCNGAFMPTEWIPNDHVAAVKNPRFFDADNVKLKKIIWYPVDDYSAGLKRLRAGELDATDRLENNEYGWIKKHMPELIDPVPQLIIDMIQVNLTKKPFDDIRVRRAINLAINREAITDKIVPVGYLPAYNLVPPNTANFPGGNAFDFKSLPYPARYAQAQALMRAAGFGPDNRLKATYMMRSTAAGYQRSVSAALQQMFALIYLDISIIPTDAQVFYKQIQEHDFEIAVPGWQADFDDASNFLDLFRTGGGNNWCAYANPAFDRALDAASEETSLEARGEKLKAAEAILLKDQAFMPLFFWVNGNLVRPYVKGFKANAMDLHKSRWITIDEKARAALFTS